MKSARSWFVIAVLGVLLLIAGFAWWQKPRKVDVAPVRAGPAVELVYATGFVEAQQPVTVSSRLTAPVVRVLVDEGDRVRRGQTLLVLDDEEQRALLSQAAAQRRSAVLDEQRTLALFAKGWTTRAARDRAVASAEAARATERSADARLGQLVLRAGIDGVVLKRDVEPGDLATPSRTLMLLGDPARVWVTATVDERYIPRLRVGQAVLMSNDAWPGRVIRGHVRELTPGGDPSQRAFRARIGIDGEQALPMGLTLEINIVSRRVDRALLIPTAALSNDQVWVVDQGRAVQRKVVAGIMGATSVQIVSGLKQSERVILSPPDDLAENERIRVNGK